MTKKILLSSTAIGVFPEALVAEAVEDMILRLPAEFLEEAVASFQALAMASLFSAGVVNGVWRTLADVK